MCPPAHSHTATNIRAACQAQGCWTPKCEVLIVPNTAWCAFPPGENLDQRPGVSHLKQQARWPLLCASVSQ